eukprot:TRINITY_DN39624_c0_g1_i1.p1 TRINITY_DN39624_c0_g1~~TRINITY_DN39624_c0_g1_i1.p1  ORF type:complete len:709 (+),score=236.77 TRINITY_DN39624_c0_g1_i1:69-2195(+)
MVGLSGKQKRKLLRDKRAEKSLLSAGDRPAGLDADTRIVSDIGEARGIGEVASSAVLPDLSSPTAAAARPKTIGTVRSLFLKETPEEVEERRDAAAQPMRARVFDSQGVPIERWYSMTGKSGGLPRALPIPHRPVWSAVDSKEDVERRESEEYRKWLSKIWKVGAGELNTFELNLDVWRQLWRVVETSDVVLLVADARYPHFHVPAALVSFAKSSGKPMMIVLNKVDLVPSSLVAAWKGYFLAVWPDVPVCEFTCSPQLDTTTGEVGEGQWRRGKKKQRTRRGAAGAAAPADDPDDMETFKGEQQLRRAERREAMPDQAAEFVAESADNILKTARRLFEDAGRSGMLTLGMVGHPNVGKSSLINALRGAKVVSTSMTAGRTKHLQHIPVSDELRLCDCPGLTFPVMGVPRAVQVVTGTLPLAQNREPFTAVQYLAERVPLEKIYGLVQPKDLSGPCGMGDDWSGYQMCEAFAARKSFYVAKNKGAPDAYRGGQQIIREAIEGRLVLFFRPPALSPGLPEMAAYVEPLDDVSSDEEDVDDSGAEEEPEAAADGDFHPCPAYDGSRPGFVFKAGDRGVGYYRDVNAPPAAPLRGCLKKREGYTAPVAEPERRPAVSSCEAAGLPNKAARKLKPGGAMLQAARSDGLVVSGGKSAKQKRRQEPQQPPSPRMLQAPAPSDSDDDSSDESPCASAGVFAALNAKGRRKGRARC